MRRPGAAELSYLDSETFDAWSQARKMWCCSSRSRPTFTLPQSSYPLFGDREKKKTQDKASTILVALFLKVKDSVAIAIRSLKDRFVTIVSLTLVLI